MKLPYELNLLISGLKDFQYGLEWQLFGNSYDDVRLELTWRKIDGLTKNFLSKGRDEEWKLKKHSVPLEATADLLCGNGKSLAESAKKAGAENAKGRENEGHHTAVVKADKSVVMGVSMEGKKNAVADSTSDTASRRLRLHMTKASLDSNIVCEEAKRPALEKSLAREDSFIRKGGKKSPFRRLKKDEKLPTTGRLQLSLSVDHLDVIVPRESAGSAVHNVVQKILGGGGSKPDTKVARPKSQVYCHSDGKSVPKFVQKDVSGASLMPEIPVSKAKTELRSGREETNGKRAGTKGKKTEACLKEGIQPASTAGPVVLPQANPACRNKDVHPKQESATDYKDAASKILPSESPSLTSIAKDTEAREGVLDCLLSVDKGSTTNQDPLLNCAPSESSEIKTEQVANSLSTTSNENADHSPGILNSALAEGMENCINPLQSFNGAPTEENENTNEPCQVVHGALAASVKTAGNPCEAFSDVMVAASENANEPCAESIDPGTGGSSELNGGEDSITMNGVHDQCDDSLAKRISQIILSRKGSLGKGTLKRRARTKDRTRTTNSDEDVRKVLRPRSKSSDPTKWSSSPDDGASDESRTDFALSNENGEKKEAPKRKGRQSWKYEET